MPLSGVNEKQSEISEHRIEDKNHVKSQNAKTHEKATCFIDLDIFCSQFDHNHVLTVGVGNKNRMEHMQYFNQNG
jgi:hypothetical protein